MTNLIETAKALAIERHEGQFRKGLERLPYVTHCEEVAQLVASFGGSDNAIAAAWLHDTVEDTPTSLDEIAKRLSSKVSALVAEVTDDPALGKADQRAAQIATAASKSAEAAIIKACDQISNMRSIMNSPPYWTSEKAQDYIDKARAVVERLPVSAEIRAVFASDAGAASEKAASFPTDR